MASASLADRAVDLARRWVTEAAAAEADPAVARLAGVLRDEDGTAFLRDVVDGVLRPESLNAAATALHRLAPDVPGSLPWRLRASVRLGGGVAPVLPTPVVPLARRALRDLVGPLVVDARPAKLGPAIEKLRATGARPDLMLFGEAVQGDAEAQRRLDGVAALIRRPDVDRVTITVSSAIGRFSPWGFDETVDRAVERLLPLFLAASDTGTVLTLDGEGHRHLDHAIAVFTRLLEDPRLTGLTAGIVLQTSLPDALPALQELTAWAQDRVAHGGARIAVRLTAGANGAAERVEARRRGWTPAAYDTRLDADANHLRCLDWALRPAHTAAVQVGVAGSDLFGIAWTWLLADDREVRDAVDVEMPLGTPQGQVQAVAREVGPVLLSVPVVSPDAFDVAAGSLVRRLDDDAFLDALLSAAGPARDASDEARDEANDEVRVVRAQDRFLDALDRSTDATLHRGPRRTQSRLAPVHESVRPVPSAPVPEADLTKAVLGISRGSDADTGAFLETAVYSARERGEDAGGAPGFANTADTDPSLPANREWAHDVRARIAASTAGSSTLAAARIDDIAAVDRTVQGVHDAAAAWGARPAAERSEVLLRAAAALESLRGELIEVAAAETGMVLAEADTEVTAAVDSARYYAATCRELDAVSGAVFEPSRVTVVAPPWSSPLAIPAGGVLAALAAGSGVVLTPAPQARRCAAVVAEALWQAGVPRGVLAVADVEEGDLGRALITHESIDRVILTGAWETAALFRSWRPDLALLAETGGKNAMIITPSADLDLAVADLVASAFGHAGQKCAAASLAILVGPVGRSQRFARQLTDAVRSLHVGQPTDPLAEVGPVIERPQGTLAWALTTLEGEERWLIEPAVAADDESGRLWRPGVRVGVQPGSRFHTEEFFGPVLGVMHASTLAKAVEMQNAVEYGLTAGLHTRDPEDLAFWLERVQAGTLFVNRGTTGAVVQRQPFGGWKRSSVGAGAKPGGPNHLIGLGTWRAQHGGAASSTLHLRGLDSRITTLIESAQSSLAYEEFEWLRRSALSDALAWDREFGRVRDVSRLEGERNLFRYRPVPVEIRATGDATLQDVLRVVLAGVRAGAGFVLSTPSGLPAAVRHALSDLDATVFLESEGEWMQRMLGTAGADGDLPSAVASAVVRQGRVRLVGGRSSVAALHAALTTASGGDPDLAVYDGEVTSAGRIELLPFVREQSISITTHRDGTPDPWSAPVI